MLWPKASSEDVVEKILGVVHVHLDFFEDDLTLFLDVFGIELGAKDEVGEDVERDGQMGVQHLGVETDLFLGGEGIQHAADGIHFAGNVFGRTALGTLEDHVLKEMGSAVFRRGFAAGAMANPNADGDGADVLHSLGDNDEAVG